MNSSKISSIGNLGVESEKTGTFDMLSGGTGPITKAISRRRSHRRQWRIFECIAMVVLDAWLISVSFQLAFAFRVALPENEFLHRALIFSKNFLANESGSGIPLRLSDIYQPKFLQLWVAIVVGLVLIFALRGLYKIRLTGSWFRQAWSIVSSSTLGLAFMITYYFASAPQGSSRLLILFTWAFTIMLLCVGRLIVSGAMAMLYRVGLGETRLLVVGSGRLGKMVMQHIAANPSLGYSIVGFLPDMNDSPSDFGRFRMLGTLDDIGLVIRSMQIDEVVIALPAHMHQYAIRSVKMCERLGASFKLIPDIYGMNLSRVDVETIEGIPLIGIKQVSLNTTQRFITRLVDICVSSLVLVLGSPLFLCIALIIKLTSPGPAVFKQTRVGLNGQLFEMCKFRSMYQDAEKRLSTLLAKNEASGPLFKMKDDPRRTAIGKFLRLTSLDEVPQFINIFKGEMSLVGPRPALEREVALYEDWQRGRLAIKPGLTGLWQVRGRSDLTFDEGVLLDLYYIENWSLRLYFQILLRTIPAVLLRRGAY